MQIVVLGMHRSGTSAVSRILNLAGAYFGPEGISNGADAGNPKGFWERRDVRAVCDGLLQESGFDWWRLSGFSVDAISDDTRERQLGELRTILLELDAHRPWVVKEPRLSVLLPVVRPLLEVPVCVHVYREPLEVAESLRVRNGFPISVGLALWELYTIHSVRASEGLPRLLVRYEDLMADPIGTVATLVEGLQGQGVHGLRGPSDQELEAFLSAALHRQRRSKEQRTLWLTQRQADLALPFDQGRIPEGEELGVVSEGARDALRSFEELKDEHARTAAAAEAALDALRADLARQEERAAQAAQADAARREQAELERARQARLVGEVGVALDDATRRVEAVVATRRWRTVHRLTQIRRGGTTRDGARRDPLDKVRVDIGRARRHLDAMPEPGAADAIRPS